MLKRMMSYLLALMMTVALIPSAQAAFSWRLTNGTLVFSGDGEMSTSIMWKRDQFGRATGVEVQAGITTVVDSAFSALDKVSKVTLADTVTKIGSNAFSGCTSLGAITLPANLTTLGASAFKNCTALKSLSVPAGVSVIENGTFTGCAGLETIEFCGNVTRLGTEAFKGCTKLSVFAVPEGVKRLYPQTFAYCTGLVQVYLPASLQQVDEDVFAGCTGLTDIYYGGTRAQWGRVNVEDGVLADSGITIHYNARATDLDASARPANPVGLYFDDVLPDYWGYDAVMSIAAHGLVTGTRQPDANGVGSFSPGGEVTLGQFLVVVTRLVCPDKREDAPGHWARGSYNAALETGIIESGQFSSTDAALDAPLNRQNMAYILVRAARLQGETFTVHPDAQGAIRDFGWIAENRRQEVLECYSNGIISGYGDGSFGPDNTMTRGQMAVVICRLAGWQDRAKVSF